MPDAIQHSPNDFSQPAERDAEVGRAAATSPHVTSGQIERAADIYIRSQDPAHPWFQRLDEWSKLHPECKEALETVQSMWQSFDQLASNSTVDRMRNEALSRLRAASGGPSAKAKAPSAKAKLFTKR